MLEAAGGVTGQGLPPVASAAADAGVPVSDDAREFIRLEHAGEKWAVPEDLETAVRAFGDALALLRHALASGSDPVPMLAAFAMKVRTMAKVAGARGSSGQLAGQLGLAPWQVERAQRDVRGWTEAGLASAIELLAETDAQIKGGGRDPVFALERMVTAIAARGI